MARTGGLRVRIEIWRNTQTGSTADNEPIMEASLWKETWAHMSHRRGREHFTSNQVFSLTSFYFTCRYYSVVGLQATDWIVVNGQHYDIENISPDFQRKGYVVVEARVQDLRVGGV
jgi:head-tail adaptor